MVILNWHGYKYKVHKLYQRCILKSPSLYDRLEVTMCS